MTFNNATKTNALKFNCAHVLEKNNCGASTILFKKNKIKNNKVAKDKTF